MKELWIEIGTWIDDRDVDIDIEIEIDHTHAAAFLQPLFVQTFGILLKVAVCFTSRAFVGDG